MAEYSLHTRFVLSPRLSWVPPKQIESWIWVQLIDVGGDPRTQSERVRKRDREGRKANDTCDNEEVTSEGNWGSVLTGDTFGNFMLHT